MTNLMVPADVTTTKFGSTVARPDHFKSGSFTNPGLASGTATMNKSDTGYILHLFDSMLDSWLE